MAHNIHQFALWFAFPWYRVEQALAAQNHSVHHLQTYALYNMLSFGNTRYNYVISDYFFILQE